MKKADGFFAVRIALALFLAAAGREQALVSRDQTVEPPQATEAA